MFMQANPCTNANDKDIILVYRLHINRGKLSTTKKVLEYLYKNKNLEVSTLFCKRRPNSQNFQALQNIWSLSQLLNSAVVAIKEP